MRIGCCAYSYRDALTSGSMTLEQFLDAAVAMNLDGVELTTYYLKQTDRDYLNRIKREYQDRINDIRETFVRLMKDELVGRRILEDELSKEEAKLADLRKEFNGGEPERRGDERNYQKYLDRVQRLKDDIGRSEVNIASLKRELASVRE